MFDSHIHLEQYENIERQIDSWKLAGVSGLIAVSTDLSSSYRTLKLQSKFPEFIHAAVGFHPERRLPSTVDIEEWKTLVRLERKRIVAVGEVGLPHYSINQLPHSLDHYLDFLSECLEVSTQYNLPVVLHAVHDKAKLAYDLLRERKVTSAHFHWLKAPIPVVEQIINAGYFISVTPEVCYRSRDQKLATKVPLSQLLIETDGPWSFSERFLTQQTSPLFLSEIVDALSCLRDQPKDILIEQLNRNTTSCYQLAKKAKK
ncbi:TatD family hydrolase [Bacillus pinisoli]|uniref:TatD family hydrolase n=1 Tax=Bacillus pinisoli TaxID=2901866 RepID=UPI001FF515C7|nr:TatD family hydrolase [Bacillus pinisoli]